MALIAAGIVFVLAFVAVYVIQVILPPDSTWDLIGPIAYFGGPLPIFPAALATAGILALMISSLLRKNS